eukprot:TRINITY_DN16189_c0_g1_i1.p1 TRINITY_DN16189_c0_g1~~TRINITY_DN16189_c0_g1_i1.p1  ORF type:complete len:142 (+),score=24.77 TRINITY_DN16189_c0_g1_i1:127-552(+)
MSCSQLFRRARLLASAGPTSRQAAALRRRLPVLPGRYFASEGAGTKAPASGKSAAASSSGEPNASQDAGRPKPEEKYYWSPEDIGPVRRFCAQWGGLMFFGFFMGLAWLAKIWGEYNYNVVDREMEELEKRRRRRRRQDDD